MTERFEYVVIGLGALGSATCQALARRGHQVLGLERHQLGHDRGASHDTSRILRHSYHTPGYVRLTKDAYRDWAELERLTGQRLVTVVGGLDLFPPEPAIPMSDYTSSMQAEGVPFDVLDAAAVQARWPQFALPEQTTALYQEASAIVPAARGTEAMQDLARRRGATLRDHCPVDRVRDLGSEGLEVMAAGVSVRCRRLVVCADAWTNQVLTGLGVTLPLDVTLEQATYFDVPEPDPFQPGRLPLWIWMDDPSFYGFPCYGEATVKAAQDCGGRPVNPDRTADEVDGEMLARLDGHVRSVLPGVGEPVRSVRCLYTLTPDRDFVLGPVPGHESVIVGLGAAHGFKFAPTFGRLLADLAERGETNADVTPFRLDRPALTDPAYQPHHLV
jgi:sarcosine oxidase